MRLTPTEAAILALLEEHPNEVVAPGAIVTGALGYPQALGNKHDRDAIRAHVSNMRRKGASVQTKRGHGYYVGELPPAPPDHYVAWCRWCGGRFTEPKERHPRFRYCREHRSAYHRARMHEGRAEVPV